MRVRIGVGKPSSLAQGASHVLKRPAKANRAALDDVIEIAADAVEAVLAEGVEPSWVAGRLTDTGATVCLTPFALGTRDRTYTRL